MPSQSLSENKFILSVIIPAYKTPEHILQRTLDSVRAQNFSDQIEIIVIDSSPSAYRNDFQQQFSGVKFHHLSRQTYCGGARNIGVEIAKSDWLSFLDSDCSWGITWFEESFRIIKSNPQALAHCGPIFFESPASKMSFALHLKEFHEFTDLHSRESRFLPGGNVLIRKEIFKKIGGYKSDWASCEDIGLLSQIPSDLKSLPILYSPELKIFHAERKMTDEEIRSKLVLMGELRFKYDRHLSENFRISRHGILLKSPGILALVFFTLIYLRILKLRSAYLLWFFVMPLKILKASYFWSKGLVSESKRQQ